MIDVSDIRYVKFTDCEDPIIDIKVSDAKQVVYPIIVWRKGETGYIYKSAHDRDGKVETGNSKFDLVNKKQRSMSGLEILAIIEKTGGCVFGVNDVQEYKLKNAFINSKVGWMFDFKNKSRSIHVSCDTINHFFFYFDEKGDRAAFEVYE